MRSAASARQQPTFLVVDDEPLVSRSIARAIAPYGRVEQAHNVVDARLALTGRDACTYACVIVDVMLGDANGFEIVDIALRHCPNAAVLVITGSTDVTHTEEALRREVRVIRKPFDPSELTQWVESAIRSAD